MVEYNKKYWLCWADAYIEDVEDETPENMTTEHRENIARWLFKLAQEQHENWKRAGV